MFTLQVLLFVLRLVETVFAKRKEKLTKLTLVP